MRPFRRRPPDRRAARLLAMTTQRAAPADPVEVSGIDALGCVLAAYAPERLLGRGEARASDRALRAAAHRLAAEARAQDAVRAERLLIELRRRWQKLPEIQRVPDDGRRRALWDRLVRLCCEEFYAPAPVAAPATRGATAVA